jgi:hypothetical protein
MRRVAGLFPGFAVQHMPLVAPKKKRGPVLHGCEQFVLTLTQTLLTM